MTAHVPVDWPTIEALVAAALAADPDRTRALVCERAPTPEERAAQNLEAIVAAVGRNPGTNARRLRDYARAEARERFGRGLSGTEHDAAVRMALCEGLLVRDGDRRAGYRYEPGVASDTPVQEPARDGPRVDPAQQPRTQQQRPETAPTPRRQRAVDTAQEHVRGREAPRPTRDAQNGQEPRDRSGSRAESSQDTGNTARGNVRHRSGGEECPPHEGQATAGRETDGSRGSHASERVTREAARPFERGRP